MERLSAPERTREELRALMNGELGTAAGRSDLVRLALRLIVEEALEGEVSDALGRERYERGEGEKVGYRNGYRPGKVKTAEGTVDYSAPQVRDTAEPFVSKVRAALSGRTRELERLAGEPYARGLSTRDIEDAFTDETGQRLLSRAAVSEITEKLWAEYEDFCKRDLSEHAVVYLFVDGIAERLRPGQRRGGCAGRMGDRRGWPPGAVGANGGLEGGRRDGSRVLPGPARQRAWRSASRGQRRGAGNHPGNRGMFSPIGPPALPGAPDAQPRGQGPSRSVAGVQSAGHSLLSGALEGDRPATRGGRPRRLRRSPAERACLLRGRFRGLYRPPAAASHAPPLRANDKSPRTAVRRGTAKAEDHSQWLRRESGAQAHVRRAHSRRRALARPSLHRVRAAPDRRREEGARQRISDLDHAAGPVIPALCFQQIRALTPADCRSAGNAHQAIGKGIGCIAKLFEANRCLDVIGQD